MARSQPPSPSLPPTTSDPGTDGVLGTIWVLDGSVIEVPVHGAAGGAGRSGESEVADAR